MNIQYTSTHTRDGCGETPWEPSSYQMEEHSAAPVWKSNSSKGMGIYKTSLKPVVQLENSHRSSRLFSKNEYVWRTTYVERTEEDFPDVNYCSIVTNADCTS